MKITSVHISNFRGHEDTKIALHDYHTLVGENGSGKTAILEAVNLACSPYFLQSRISEQDFNSADKGNISIVIEFDKYFLVKIPDGFATQDIPCQSIRLEAKRRSQASHGKALSEPFVASSLCIPTTYASTMELDASLLPDDISLNDLPPKVEQAQEGEQTGVLITRKNGNSKTVRNNLLSLNNELVGFPNVFYFDRYREKETKTGFNSLFSKITKEFNWRYRKSIDPTTAQTNWENYYNSVIDSVDKRLNKDLFGPVLKKLAGVLSPQIKNLEISLINLEEPFAKGFISLRDGLNQIDMSGVGSGISILISYYLLEHLGQLAKGSSIFLIDEPELHLHPQLKRHLKKYLMDSSSQTILSTHSPWFVDLGNWNGITRLMDDKTVAPTKKILDQKLGQESIRKHLDDITKWRQHQTIFVDSDPELLFSRKVLLVEGPTEKYGLPRLADVMEKSFPDTTIVSCNGKGKIIHYATICHAYEIPTFVLFDLDGKSETDTENSNTIDSIANFDSCKFKSSFELLLGIGTNTEHKSSKVLEKIDNVASKEEIPEDIQAAITAIDVWSKK